MTAGSRSSPANAVAGSPGNSCCSPKINSDTKNRVGTIRAIRRRRNVVMYEEASLHPDPLRADQPVRIRGEAGELRTHSVQIFVMPQINQRPVGQHILSYRRVMRHSLGGVGGLPRSPELAVDLGVAVVSGVQRGRRFAGDEIVDVAVRVSAAAP